jgi:hypothetical protein
MEAALAKYVSYSDIYLVGWRKTTKLLSRNIRNFGRDSKLAPSECNS